MVVQISVFFLIILCTKIANSIANSPRIYFETSTFFASAFCTGINITSMVNVNVPNAKEAKSKLSCFQSLVTQLPNNCERKYPVKVNQNLVRIDRIFQSGFVQCSDGSQRQVQAEYFTGLNGSIFMMDINENGQKIGFNKKESLAIAYEIQVKNYLTPGQNEGHDYTPRALFTNHTFLFQCDSVSYIFYPEKRIWMKLKNEDILQEVELDHSNSNYESHGVIDRFKYLLTLSTNTEALICTANPREDGINAQISLKSNLKLKVDDQKSPIFQEDTRHFKFSIDEKTPFLLCRAEGIPPPKMEFYRNNELVTVGINKLAKEGHEHIYLNLKRPLDKSIQGEYVCSAENSAGKNTLLFTIEVLDPPTINNSLSAGVLSGIVVGSLLLLFIFSFILVWYIRKGKRIISQEELNQFFKGIPGMSADGEKDIHSIPYDKQTYEIPKNRFQVDMSRPLGSGEYGLVVHGKVEGLPVAVKTLKPNNMDKTYLLSLLAEVKIMSYMEKHPHIVNLVGAFTEELHRGIVFCFVEFCPMGDLDGFLKNHKRVFVSNFDPEQKKEFYRNIVVKPEDVISEDDLMLWSYQIANAMEYMSSKKVIHGDLAARNVLLLHRHCVKVTDFGLSRKLYEYTQYVKKNQQPLPWRWMAVESLSSMIFSSESDVWAYGIVLYEIFTLGDTPYPGLSWTIDFMDKLKNGLRNCKPTHATDELYALILTCWNKDPEDRPTFKDLRYRFEEFLGRTRYADRFSVIGKNRDPSPTSGVQSGNLYTNTPL